MLPFEQFRVVYQFLARLKMTCHKETSMILFSIKKKENESASSEKIIDEFLSVLASSLRQSDIVTKNGNNQCLVILSETTTSNVNPVTERIMHNWNSRADSSMFEISFEYGMLT